MDWRHWSRTRERVKAHHAGGPVPNGGVLILPPATAVEVVHP